MPESSDPSEPGAFASSCRGLRRVAHGLRQALVAPSLEPPHRSFAVGLRMTLAELALAVQAGEADLEAHDVAQLLGEIVGGRIAHLPRPGLTGLMLARQAGDNAPDELLVVAHVDRAVRVDDLVVPGRHAPVRLVLARVPVRRDVALHPAEDDEDVGTGGPVFVEAVGGPAGPGCGDLDFLFGGVRASVEGGEEEPSAVGEVFVPGSAK